MEKWRVSSEGPRSSESGLFWFQEASVLCLHHTGFVVVKESVLLWLTSNDRFVTIHSPAQPALSYSFYCTELSQEICQSSPKNMTVHDEHHLQLKGNVKNGGNFVPMHYISQNIRIYAISIKLNRIQFNFH